MLFVSWLFLLLICREARDLAPVLQEEIADLAPTADSYTIHPLPGPRTHHPARREGSRDLGVETPLKRPQEGVGPHGGGVGLLPRGGVDVEVRRVLLLMNLSWRIENGAAVSAEKDPRQS